jgi:hypothetical protein
MDSEAPSIDYQAVRADLIARRDELNAAIAAVERLLASNVSGPMVSAAIPIESNTKETNSKVQPIHSQVQQDSFFGLTIVDAAAKYLKMMKKPQNVEQITDALQRGGYLFQTERPSKTVRAVMHREHSNNGDVVKVGKATYGLPEWYPNRAKTR